MTWQEHAACAGTDLELWVVHPHATNAQVVEALRICANCPVRVPCLEAAKLEHAEGVIRGGHMFGSRKMPRAKASDDPRMIGPGLDAEVRRLWVDESQSQRQIARKLGIDGRTVARSLRRTKIAS